MTSILVPFTERDRAGVTRRSHPATSPGSLDGIYPGGEEGMPCPDEQSETGARVFANHSRSSIELYVFRAVPHASAASDGGTSLISGRNLSRLLKGLETGSGGYPGLSPTTNLSWRQEQKQKP
jgi:hypothetical protein